MRIIRFRAPNGRSFWAEDHQDGTATVLANTVPVDVIRTSQRVRVDKALAPIKPADIICIGRNYRASGNSNVVGHDDATLEVFLKPSTALQHPDEPVFIPNFEGIDAQLDCEGELAVIVSREARNVSEADAMNHIFGYTIANDVTARAFQTTGGPPIWMRGKGFDTFCPLGPAIITADEIPDPSSLSIRTIVNGQVVREGNTRDMIRSVPQIIAALSRHMALRSGAVILTGAPPASPQNLKAGDIIAVEMNSIGLLQNQIVRPQDLA